MHKLPVLEMVEYSPPLRVKCMLVAESPLGISSSPSIGSVGAKMMMMMMMIHIHSYAYKYMLTYMYIYTHTYVCVCVYACTGVI
jgi:hypothetical protein